MSRTSCDVVDEAFVAAPPSAVWSAVLSENAHESSWWAPYWEAHPRGPTPLSVGSVIDYVVHPAGDRFRFIASRFTGRITDLEENRLARAELIEGDLRGIGEWILEPADGGIRVRMHFRAESRSRNLLDRLLNMVFDLGKTHSYVARKGFVGLSRHLADDSAVPAGHANGPRETAARGSAPAEATAWGTAQESRDIGRRWLKGGTNAPRVNRLRDAIRLAGVIATGVLSRRPVRPLGDEARRPLPGDDLVSGKLPWTHGVTIRARPTEIWPWLVQMGCRRAGWYSYDGLDNDGVPSADRIVPELQRVEVGDILPWTATATDGFLVRAVELERALVLGEASESFTWALVLEPIDETSTRLVTRVRARYERLAIGLMLGLVWRPIHFGMQRRQLSTSSVGLSPEWARWTGNDC